MTDDFLKKKKRENIKYSTRMTPMAEFNPMH